MKGNQQRWERFSAVGALNSQECTRTGGDMDAIHDAFSVSTQYGEEFSLLHNINLCGKKIQAIRRLMGIGTCLTDTDPISKSGGV